MDAGAGGGGAIAARNFSIAIWQLGHCHGGAVSLALRT
jgi:hypothetical protein